MYAQIKADLLKMFRASIAVDPVESDVSVCDEDEEFLHGSIADRKRKREEQLAKNKKARAEKFIAKKIAMAEKEKEKQAVAEQRIALAKKRKVEAAEANISIFNKFFLKSITSALSCKSTPI